MVNIVQDYVESRKRLMNEFQCKDDYFVKILLDYKWRLKEDDGMYFLTYLKEGQQLKECIVVKRNNQPFIVKKYGYTMIVAIECVKVAIIFNDNNEI